jgi:hypothetical protein
MFAMATKVGTGDTFLLATISLFGLDIHPTLSNGVFVKNAMMEVPDTRFELLLAMNV